MGNENLQILMGNLAEKPVLKTFENGGTVVNLRLMTNRFWRDRETGETQKRGIGHNVQISIPRLVDVAKKYIIDTYEANGNINLYCRGFADVRRFDRGNGFEYFHFMNCNYLQLPPRNGQAEIVADATSEGEPATKIPDDDIPF
jgi:single-stranded DNA-binding protein